MKIVIQCCSGKVKGAGTFTFKGRKVRFIAHPKLFDQSCPDILCRPDDKRHCNLDTWREYLQLYNETQIDNPDKLLQAADLYSPKHSPDIYRCVANYAGRKIMFILSAGWGLIKADFLVPSYDITFAREKKIPKYKIRKFKIDWYADFDHLTYAHIDPNEDIYFFGGKDYLPLYYKLTKNLVARKVIYHFSETIPKEAGYCYIPYSASRSTNWHYDCVRDFMQSPISR